MVKILNIQPNTTEQQLEKELISRHAKHWKVYNIEDVKMEATVLFATYKDRSLATKKKIVLKDRECDWMWSDKSQEGQNTQSYKFQTNKHYNCGICGKVNHVTQNCFFRQRKENLFCTICKKNGHYNSECYFRKQNERRSDNFNNRVRFQGRLQDQDNFVQKDQNTSITKGSSFFGPEQTEFQLTQPEITIEQDTTII
ncbi:hypothetical protein C1645_737509 [Glomus cerebriforme]|uniref:CCHC-type domain-containing protein n=1 Tax=Glomus cerebriforme TaxID=658196 RepID=A0A397SXX9_9GLOM|nr:hypothetical protein C1645_737509 [Glomus cerebriforme]